MSICNLQKNEEKKDEKKIAKYLVVPNIFVLSLSLSLDRAGLTPYLKFLVRAREACCARYSKQRNHRSFLCSFFVLCRLQPKGEISTILSRRNITNSHGIVPLYNPNPFQYYLIT